MKIISGGQTGIDRIALEVAKEFGLETGGTAPKFYWTENGIDTSLKEFGLKEDNKKKYRSRTFKNVINSDGTVLYGDAESSGTNLTMRFCQLHKKPFLLNPDANGFAAFILENKIEILNVAGNRASKLSLDQLNFFRELLTDSLEKLKCNNFESNSQCQLPYYFRR